MSSSSTIGNLQQALNCAGKCDCCEKLQSQIYELKDQFGRLDAKFILKQERPGIVNESVEQAKLILGPIIALVVGNALVPIKQAISYILPVVRALAPLLQVVGVLLQLAGVASNILALIASDRNFDALSARMDRIDNDIYRILGQILTNRQIAKRAEDLANKALTEIAALRKNFENQINILKNQIDQLQKYIDQQIANFRNTIEALNRRINQLEFDFKILEQAIKNLYQLFYITQRDLMLLQIELGKIRYEEIPSLYNILNNRIISLQNQISDIKNKANEAISKANEAISKANEAISKANEALKKVLELLGRFNSLEGSLQAKIEELKAYIEARLRDVNAGTGQLIDIKINQAEIKHNTNIYSHANLRRKQYEETLQTIESQFQSKTISKQEYQRDLYTTKKFYLDGLAAQGDAKAAAESARLTREDLIKNNKFLKDFYEDFDYFRMRADLESKAAQGNAKAAAEISRINQLEIDKFWAEIKSRNAGVSQSSENINTIVRQKVQQQQEQITKLDNKLKEREEMDKKIEQKLDSIIPTIAGIPIAIARVPGQVNNLVTPNIPQLPQIGNTVQDVVCNPKCQLPAINGATSAANNAANDIKRDIGDKVQKANDALQTGMLTEILRRLGDFIPGGISGKLIDGFKWLQLDRALNILIFAATVHNAAMLSNDILQTLVGALTNVVSLIVPKDDAGKSFDIGQAINSTVENVVKGIIGAENYTNLSNTWAKANRIYQATTNVLNSFMSLTQTVLQAAEMIAAYTGKIGNALKKGGVVLENAYGWMNPQPKFNRVTQTLENLQQTASTVQMVTQVPLDVVNATTELTNASTEFVKAVKEDDKPANKATPIPEPDELKGKESQAKTDSQPSPFDFSDLFDGEDL